MVRFLLAMSLAGMLLGCGSTERAAEPAASTSQAQPTVGAAPAQIAELTDETRVFECPKCGMMFTAAGNCSMGCGPLTETAVAYICPADDQAVSKAGRCERCPMNARVVKSAIAMAEPQAAPPAPTGN